MCDRLPDTMPSRFGSDTADHVRLSIAAYAAECQISLGDWRAAAQHASTALGVGRWSSGREAGAHLDLAIASAHLGSPEEALGHAGRGTALRPCISGGLLPRVRALDTVLRDRYPTVAGVQEFHERYRQLARQAVTN